MPYRQTAVSFFRISVAEKLVKRHYVKKTSLWKARINFEQIPSADEVRGRVLIGEGLFFR